MQKKILLRILLFTLHFSLVAQKNNIQFTIDLSNPNSHYFNVEMIYKKPKDLSQLKMCAWTPGSYIIHDYGKFVENFDVTNERKQPLSWQKSDVNTWLVSSKGAKEIIVNYRIKATQLFIENSYIDENIGIISPASTFLYLDEELLNPVTVKINYPINKKIATGLDLSDEKQKIYTAENYDKLLDTPFLLGNLEHLKPFYVDDVPHHFIGYEIGKLDRDKFMSELKDIVLQGTTIFNHVPFNHYSFLSYGYGPGGLEHINSCIISFRTKDILATPESRFRNYKFLAHEYFHAYNAKCIRPIELGPFDYSGPNHTNLLWFTEGVTDYYAHLMILRAKVVSLEEVNRSFQYIIRNYENKPGHKYQSLTNASYTTWFNSPFSKTKIEADKTISYYEKGCIVGLLMDFDIRQHSNNEASLDDVMNSLYQKYYKKLGRGFTEEELKKECELFAGAKMDEVFSYTNTTNPLNYKKYFEYAGLKIDTVMTEGSYLGLTFGMHDREFLPINSVVENSPAWNAGVRKGFHIINIEGKQPSKEIVMKYLLLKKPTEKLHLKVRTTTKEVKDITVILGAKKEKKFFIEIMKNRTDLQKRILDSWSKG